MKQKYIVCMTDDCDQHIFLHEGHAKDCTCTNHLENINGLVELELDETEKAQLEESKYVQEIFQEREARETSLTFTEQNTTFRTGSTPSVLEDGTDFSPMMFPLGSNTGTGDASLAGYFDESGELNQVPNQSVLQTFIGEYVDIVAMEAGSPSTFYNNYDNHPDFLDADGISRFVAENWSDYATISNPSVNDQITNNIRHSSHAIGVLSIAGGRYCGWAKNSSLRTIYLGSFTENANAIIGWHNQKPINPKTGVRNATVVTGSWGYYDEHFIFGVKPDDITKIDTFDSDFNPITVTRPAGGWGTDLTEFTSRYIIPRAMYLSGDNQNDWIIPCGSGSRNATFDNTICASLAAANCYFFKSMGNESDISVGPDHYLFNTTITVEANATYYRVINGNTIDGGTLSSQFALNRYPLKHYTNGGNNAFWVAAGQNSNVNPLLDAYSSRGPSADITGYGEQSYTSYPISSDVNSWQWGNFGGTSCAAPSVAGAAALVIEWWRAKYQDWPTVAELKNYLQTNATNNLAEDNLVDFTNMPTASSTISSTRIYDYRQTQQYWFNIGDNPNGGTHITELAGTPNYRLFLPDEVRVGKGQTIRSSRTEKFGSRPATGQAYPRRKIKIG